MNHIPKKGHMRVSEITRFHSIRFQQILIPPETPDIIVMEDANGRIALQIGDDRKVFYQIIRNSKVKK